MRIYTKIEFDWNGNILASESYEYIGEIDRLCGAPAGQKELATQQAAYYGTLTQNANAEFAQAKDLANIFESEYMPIFLKGKDQLGWSEEERLNINSQIVTTEGEATKNALKATGLATNALGGGNEFVPQGAVRAGKAAIDVAGAQETAKAQQNALLANYAAGHKNFQEASAALAGIPSLYSPTSGAAQVATESGSAANKTYADIAAESMGPLNLISSAMGAAGAAMSGRG